MKKTWKKREKNVKKTDEFRVFFIEFAIIDPDDACVFSAIPKEEVVDRGDYSEDSRGLYHRSRAYQDSIFSDSRVLKKRVVE